MKPGNGLRRKSRLQAKTGLKRGAQLPRRTPLRAVPKAEAKAAPKPRARKGSLRAAVALVVAGEATCAQAARICGLDDDRVPALKDAAAREFRRLVMECQGYECGAKLDGCLGMATDVQHRQKKRSGGTSDPKIAYSPVNGAAMCRPCHIAADERYDEGLHARGFWLESHEDPALVPLAVATEYGLSLRWLLPDGSWTAEPPEAVTAA